MKMDIEMEDVNTTSTNITSQITNDFNNTLFTERAKQLDFVDLSDPNDSVSNIHIEREEPVTRESYVFKKPSSGLFCKMGNTYAFWFNKNDEPRIVIGPHCKFYN